jgi:F-type H+-transporting ATPase subunit O
MLAAVLVFLQPDPPVFLTSMSGSIATKAWQVAAKENQLEKVQDELHQVSMQPRY